MSSDLVTVGLGYVGLPLVRAAVRSGLSVVGLDASPRVVDSINAGRSLIDDLDDRDLAAMLATGFRATTDPACLAGADTIVICVPTPLAGDGTPDLDAVRNAARAIGEHITPGTMVILESTSYPGTTQDLLGPIVEEHSGLKAGIDFSLAYSPERIDPGNRVYGIENTPKVVGGLTPECTERACDFYSRFVENVVATAGTREAELAKLLENTYRHVNIALMNEMAVFCDELDIDLWSAIEAARTKPFGFEAFYPGPGVGGHCIPIDPNYLSYAVRSMGHQFRFVELAREISGRMPTYVVSRAQRMLNDEAKPVKGARILLVGVTYKENVRDDRETPARPIARLLRDLGADVTFHDPYVTDFEVDNLPIPFEIDLRDAVRRADLVILLQPHDSVLAGGALADARIVFDTRGVLNGTNVERL